LDTKKSRKPCPIAGSTDPGKSLKARITREFSPVVTWAVFGAIYGSMSYCLIAKPSSLPELISGAIGFGLLWAVTTTIGLIGPWVQGGTLGPFLLGVIRFVSMGAPGAWGAPSFYEHQSDESRIFWGLPVISGAILVWSEHRILRMILFALALAGTLGIAIMYVLDGAYGAMLARLVIGISIGMLVGSVVGTIVWAIEQLVIARKRPKTQPGNTARAVADRNTGTRVPALSTGSVTIWRLGILILAGAIGLTLFLIFR
jgi:hypothetical protein